MSVKEMSTTAVLAALLYVVYMLGSFVLYLELVNFTVLLYGVYLSRKQAWLSVTLFCILVVLTKGLGFWSVMYVVVFPQFALIYSFIRNVTKNEYVLGAVGFVLAFLCGTLIDLPSIAISGVSGQALVLRFLMGFQVSLGNAACTIIATLFLLKPLGSVFVRANLTVKENVIS